MTIPTTSPSSCTTEILRRLNALETWRADIAKGFAGLVNAHADILRRLEVLERDHNMLAAAVTSLDARSLGQGERLDSIERRLDILEEDAWGEPVADDGEDAGIDDPKPGPSTAVGAPSSLGCPKCGAAMVHVADRGWCRCFACGNAERVVVWLASEVEAQAAPPDPEPRGGRIVRVPAIGQRVTPAWAGGSIEGEVVGYRVELLIGRGRLPLLPERVIPVGPGPHRWIEITLPEEPRP